MTQNIVLNKVIWKQLVDWLCVRIKRLLKWNRKEIEIRIKGNQNNGSNIDSKYSLKEESMLNNNIQKFVAL
jgi:hypothetical protein